MNRIQKIRKRKQTKKIAVLLADDHAIVREAIRHILQSAPDIEVIGEASDGQQVIERAKELLPAVILLDLAMPLMCGTETIRHLANTVPASKVLILSGYQDAEIIRAAIDAGASGYFVKQSASQELLTAIRNIANGKAVLLKDQKKAPEPTLSQRQTQVLQLIAQGLANKQIAGALSISIKTVGIHRQSILDKLNIHETATLTRYAIARGMIPCDRPKLVAH